MSTVKEIDIMDSINDNDTAELEFEPEPEEPEPDEENDYFLSDDARSIYYGGKRIVGPVSATAEPCPQDAVMRELAEYVEEEWSRKGYWPNVWAVSDHGNAVLISVLECGCYFTAHGGDASKHADVTDQEQELPPCVRAMRCYCAGHARGNPVDAPCDTSENADEPSDDTDPPLSVVYRTLERAIEEVCDEDMQNEISDAYRALIEKWRRGVAVRGDGAATDTGVSDQPARRVRRSGTGRGADVGTAVRIR